MHILLPAASYSLLSANNFKNAAGVFMEKHVLKKYLACGHVQSSLGSSRNFGATHSASAGKVELSVHTFAMAVAVWIATFTVPDVEALAVRSALHSCDKVDMCSTKSVLVSVLDLAVMKFAHARSKHCMSRVLKVFACRVFLARLQILHDADDKHSCMLSCGKARSSW